MSAQPSPSGNGSRSSVETLDPEPPVVELVPLDKPTPNDPPDVFLDALVAVQEIKLDVRGLRAHLAVNAEVASLVKLSVGADVSLERVTLTITGVEVKALLEVRLDEVRAILDKALTLLIENPEILEVLARTVVDVVKEIGDVVEGVVDGVVQEVVAPVVDGVVRGVLGVVPSAPGGVVLPGPGGVVPPAPGGVVPPAPVGVVVPPAPVAVVPPAPVEVVGGPGPVDPPPGAVD